MRPLKRWKSRTLLFLAVVGPGIITANVDNDAGGILVYSQAGAQYGFLLLWTMIPITLALIVVQEMSARMGAVTGKGLSDLIRDRVADRGQGPIQERRESVPRRFVLLHYIHIRRSLGASLVERCGVRNH